VTRTALYSVFEKAFMVWLVLSNARQPYAAGFWIPFAVDISAVAHTTGHFACCGFDIPVSDQLGPARWLNCARELPGGEGRAFGRSEGRAQAATNVGKTPVRILATFLEATSP
jgi:hypothetical protein